MSQITLHFDGACEPINPGGWMVWAWILQLDGAPLGQGACIREPQHDNTNNVAEWFALGAGLKELMQFRNQSESLQKMPLLIRGDSQLVIKQLNGEWAVNKQRLRDCRQRCIAMLRDHCWKAEWVQRDQNAAADALGRAKYLEVTGRAMPERRRKVG
jgi:ribonuclease HI